MKVEDAVAKAKDYVVRLFSDESLRDVGLEEVVKEADVWAITIGFRTQMQFDRPNTRAATILRDIYGDRRFKVVRLNDGDGEIVSLTDRIIEASA